jgi:iron complex outermembrane receptor protein
LGDAIVTLCKIRSPRLNLRSAAFCGAALPALLAHPAVSQAQQAPAAGPAVLGEIVVTARKRAENVQSIPKPVQVMNQVSLRQAGVSNLQDLNFVATSIQGSSTSTAAAILGPPPAIRGITSFAYSIGVQAQTGLVLDDVPQPNFSTLADELSDIERVEVLPGPQSTLSGRNAAGGLINIVTRSPSSTLKAEVTAEATNDHQQRVAGFVSGPIADTLAFSLSGFYNKWDGPLRNVATGNRLGGWDRSGVRGKLQYRPNDKLTATLTGYYTHNDAPTAALVSGYPYVYLSPQGQSFFVPLPLQSVLPFKAQPYNRDILSAHEGDLESKDKGATLRLDYETDLGTFSSISNISSSKTHTVTPLAAFAFFPNVPVQQDYNIDYKTQEFRLASPGSDTRLKYLAGLIYSDTEINEPYSRALIAPVNWDRTSRIRSTALYGNVTYEVVPQTFLTGGLRLQHDDQAYDWIFVDGTAPESHGSNTYNFVSGEVSLRHEFTRDFSAYVTYSNSQTGRAYDLEDQVSATTPSGLKPLDSEKVQNVELGIKSQWLDRRLTFNASAFDAKYKNYQMQQAYLASAGSLPSIRLFSIGKVETRGVELDSAFAATPDLTLSAAATFLDAVITDYPNAICYTGQTLPSCAATPGNQGNLAGLSMPGTSHFKATASANYTLRLPALPFDGTFSAFYRYQSSQHFDVLGDPVTHIDGYGILNLAVGVQDHDHRYSLQFFVNNVLNKNYYALLARDTVTFDPTGANPVAVYGGYARDSFRYAGVRLSLAY